MVYLILNTAFWANWAIFKSCKNIKINNNEIIKIYTNGNKITVIDNFSILFKMNFKPLLNEKNF